jgi:hypothetical protein
MFMRKLSFAIVLVLMLSLVGGAVLAQDDMMTPSVTVSDQVSTDGTVTVDNVVSPDFGFIVIHADNGDGAPGPVIGYRALPPGENSNVVVALDTINATSTLFAMLHEDTGNVGEYEFGAVEGADGPVVVDGAPVTPAFTVELMEAQPQFAEESVMMNVVVASQPGFVVIHADNGEGAPGPVIGNAYVEAGTTLEVEVMLDGDATNTVFPMLHVDTGEPGAYEFGEVEGADGPVAIDGNVAVFPVSTVPTVNANPQIVLPGDARMNEMGTTSFVAEDVLSDGAGWLVVHADNDGAPGTVLGFAPVQDGYNADVRVELDTEDVTPVLFPMLHTDSGEPQVYEFGEVEGADAPVSVDGNVVTFPVQSAPSITYEGTLEDSTLTIEQALIDGPGWLVIHADNDGAPGAVLGFAPLLQGVNYDIAVELDTENMTDTVFPMLHYDNSEFGVYEFGQVEGADGPVVVQGEVIAGPFTPGEMMDSDS